MCLEIVRNNPATPSSSELNVKKAHTWPQFPLLHYVVNTFKHTNMKIHMHVNTHIHIFTRGRQFLWMIYKDYKDKIAVVT